MHEISTFNHTNEYMSESNLVFRSESGKVLTTSLKVAETFGKEHKNVLKDIRELQCSEEFNRLNFELANYTDLKGEKRPMYVMTRDGFTILAMGYTGKKAMEFKERYIAAFNQMEKTIIEMKEQNMPKVPTSFAQALYLAAKQQEKIEEQQRLIAENKPKAEFFDAVTDSKDAIEMKAVANVLNFKNIGRNKLFDILRCYKILTERNLPMQRYIDCGYFRTIEQKYSKPNGDICINIKTVVYQTGVAFIRKVLTNLGYTSK